jgi:hypothetical protein
MQHFFVLRNGHVDQYFELPLLRLVRIALLPFVRSHRQAHSLFSAIDSYFNCQAAAKASKACPTAKADVVAARYSGGRQYHNNDTIAFLRDTWDVYAQDW